MKVLGISGSPRKGGNTEIFVSETLRTIDSMGLRTELLAVAGRRILPSTGDDERDMSLDDDAHEFTEKMLEADGIIIGSPVYFQNTSGQLKSLMDRTHYFHVGYRLRGKVGGAIAVTGSTGVGSTLAIINSFFLQHRMMICHPGAFAILRKPSNVRLDEAALRGAHDLGDAVASLLKRLH
ncbi:MAG: flavodoxin family protein [Candidatus Bathyarchaeia archaeon]